MEGRDKHDGTEDDSASLLKNSVSLLNNTDFIQPHKGVSLATGHTTAENCMPNPIQAVPCDMGNLESIPKQISMPMGQVFFTVKQGTSLDHESLPLMSANGSSLSAQLKSDQQGAQASESGTQGSSGSEDGGAVKRRRSVDHDKMSEEYRKKRERNNVSVRKSREKSRQKAHETSRLMQELRADNAALEQRVEILSKEVSVLRDLLLTRSWEPQEQVNEHGTDIGMASIEPVRDSQGYTSTSAIKTTASSEAPHVLSVQLNTSLA